VEVRCGEGVAIHTGLESCVTGHREVLHRGMRCAAGCAMVASGARPSSRALRSFSRQTPQGGSPVRE
jgi:hypothetical protein